MIIDTKYVNNNTIDYLKDKLIAKCPTIIETGEIFKNHIMKDVDFDDINNANISKLSYSVLKFYKKNTRRVLTDLLITDFEKIRKYFNIDLFEFYGIFINAMEDIIDGEDIEHIKIKLLDDWWGNIYLVLNFVNGKIVIMNTIKTDEYKTDKDILKAIINGKTSNDKTKEVKIKPKKDTKEDVFYKLLTSEIKADFKRQFPIANKINSTYRLDFYLPEAQLIIEYDEEHHKNQIQKDVKRMNEIVEHLNLLGLNPKVIRVKEGYEKQGIEEVKNYLLEKGIFNI